MNSIEVNKIKTFKGHKDAIYSICEGLSSSSFITAGSDGQVVQWDLEKLEDGRLLAKLPNSIYSMLTLKESGSLIIGHNYSGINIIDLVNRTERGTLELTDAAIFDIKRNENFLFIATGEGSVIVVDLKTMKKIKTMKFSFKSARTIAMNKDEMAVGYSDNFIRIFNLKNLKLKNEYEGHNKSVFSLKYVLDGNYLLSGSRDALLKIWDVKAGYILKESIIAHSYAINSIDNTFSKEFIVTGSLDKTLKVWDMENFNLLKVIDKARYGGHSNSVNKIFCSSYKNSVISCSDDKTISVWQIKYKGRS